MVPVSVLGFSQAQPNKTDKSGVSPKGPAAEGNPNPTGISLPKMGRKQGGANWLGVQSRKGKGTSATRAASLLGLSGVWVSGGGQGHLGSSSLAPTELRRGLATTQGTLPGLKLAGN